MSSEIVFRVFDCVKVEFQLVKLSVSYQELKMHLFFKIPTGDKPNTTSLLIELEIGLVYLLDGSASPVTRSNEKAFQMNEVIVSFLTSLMTTLNL